MTGMMSGPDSISATVTVVREGAASREFSIKSSVVSGGFRIEESARLRAVLDELAKDFVSKL